MVRRSLALSLLPATAACMAALAPSGPTRIGPVPLSPQGLRPDAFAEVRLAVLLSPEIAEARLLQAVSLRDVQLEALRSSFAAGLVEALRRSFGEVELVDNPAGAPLLLRVEELTPQHVKTGNVPLGGQVAYEMRFDVRYRAALVKGDATVASAVRTVEGRDLSWKAADQPLMLQHALEQTITDLCDQLFADEAAVRAGGQQAGAVLGKAADKAARPEATIAVMPLRSDDVKATRVLDELLVVAVDTLSPLAVISTADVNALLGHQRLRDAMGCDDVTCAAEIGGALGVDFLLTGNVSRLGSNVIVTLHLLNARHQTSVARGQATVKDDEDLYQQAVQRAVRELFGALRVQ